MLDVRPPLSTLSQQVLSLRPITISLFPLHHSGDVDHALGTRRDPPSIGRQHPAPDSPQHNPARRIPAQARLGHPTAPRTNQGNRERCGRRDDVPRRRGETLESEARVGCGRGRSRRAGAAGGCRCDGDDGVAGWSKWSAFEEEGVEGTTGWRG